MFNSEDLQKLWPLSESFEYAAELGLGQRMAHRSDWEDFSSEVALARLPLAQAQGFAFLQWLESNRQDRLLAELPRQLATAPPRLQSEFHASLNCLNRDYQLLADSGPLPDLEAEVVLFKPQASLGYYPQAMPEEWQQKALQGAEVEELPVQPASLQQMLQAHSRVYLEGLQALAEAGGGCLTPETVVYEQSWDCVLAGAGALISAANWALQNSAERAVLCQVAPGSHHAEHNRAGGTCLINNLAVAAFDSLRSPLVNHAVVLDIDAHHGNGTEQIAFQEARVLTASIHQAPPFFPGTGEHSARGWGRGKGTNLNLPVKPGQEDWSDKVIQAINWMKRSKPEIIFVELSTDAHRSDPVSDLEARDQDYFRIGQQLKKLGRPVVFELGASLSERAWVGGIRSLLNGFNG